MDKKEYVVVIYRDNYADEMKVQGFQLFSKYEWEQIERAFNKQHNVIRFYVGTNAEIEYKNPKALLSKCKVSYISETLFDSIKVIYGKNFGICPNFYDFVEVEDEE